MLSPAFAAFDAALPADPRPRLYIGIAAAEAYADLAAFAEARRRLQALGHAVVLEGASETLLALTEPAALGTDLIKLTAPVLPAEAGADLAAARPAPATATPDALRRADPERVVLAQIETPAQLAWGARLGIARFQGRQIDLLLAERRLRRCAAATACGCDATLCAAAAAALDAAGRARCGNPALLDAAIETGS